MLIQKTIHTAPLGRADYTDHQRKLPNGERRTLPFKAVEISPTVPSRRPSPNPLPKGEGVLRLGGGTDSAVVGRNKPASAGVSGNTTGRLPETVVARPYSGLQVPTLPRWVLHLFWFLATLVGLAGAPQAMATTFTTKLVGNFAVSSSPLGGKTGCNIAIGNHSYGIVEFSATTATAYTVESTGSSNVPSNDTFMAVYSPSFDPANPTANLIGCDDDSGLNLYSMFTINPAVKRIMRRGPNPK